MFSSFSNRDYRIFWIGTFISFCGTWIQSMAQNWLVFELSNSAFMLGLVGFVTYSPMLIFSLFSGVLVDRVDKRHLLIFTQIAFMILAFLLAIFTQFNIITINFILLVSLLYGIVLSFDAPARQVIVFELVGKQKILNAIALNSIAFHSARILGPAIAGIFMAVIHISGCFYINAASFLAAIIALLLIKTKHFNNNNNRHFLDDLKSGINFIKNNQFLFILIGIVGIISIFGFSYIILMPVFSKTILSLDIKGYGLLISAGGIGSLLGGLILASLKKLEIQQKILVFYLYFFCFSLISFSFSKSFIFSILIVILAGFSSVSSLAIINSIIQTIVPDEFRGRVMSIYTLTFAGTIPFSSIFAGFLAQTLGVRFTLFISGLICLLLFLFFSNKIIKYKLAI